MTVLQVFLIVLSAILLYQVPTRVIRRLHHSPAPAFIGRLLDSNVRRWLQPPAKIIKHIGIGQGMTMLDLGCGSGAFTTFAARAAGEQGKVYAVDIQPMMLQQLESKLARTEHQDITNIELKQASAYNLPSKMGLLTWYTWSPCFKKYLI